MTAETGRPFSDTIWDDVETWSRDRIEAFQLDALECPLAECRGAKQAL